MSQTILIIEDNYVMLRIWETVLVKAGFKVITTNNSRIGLLKAKEEKPSLIIIDSVLPDMDGLELCRKLRKDEATVKIPVIFMSNFEHSEDAMAAIEAGASDYMIKYNTMPEKLIGRINEILSGKWEPITSQGSEVNIND